MLGELMDEFQIGERASEYAVIFNQINAITAAEGAISGVRQSPSLSPIHVIHQGACSLCLTIHNSNLESHYRPMATRDRTLWTTW
jgi:hypothetical protein